jgi:hypothetical protein
MITTQNMALRASSSKRRCSSLHLCNSFTLIIIASRRSYTIKYRENLRKIPVFRKICQPVKRVSQWQLERVNKASLCLYLFCEGMFYRSASLYHPQRRAILHLKNQKRKIKDKNKTQATQPTRLNS